MGESVQTVEGFLAFRGLPGWRSRWLGVAVGAALALSLGLASAERAVAAAAGPVSAPAEPAEPLVAQDVASAQLTARVRGARVEVLGERTETSTTFVNPDGSFSSESFLAPVRVRAKGGKYGWKDVDLKRRGFDAASL